MRFTIITLALTIALTSTASADPGFYSPTPSTPSAGYPSAPYGVSPSTTTFKNPSGYRYVAPGVRHNPYTGSTHVAGVAVHRATGTYQHIGNGYYRNPVTGRVYNPTTGSDSVGKNVTFSPGNYQRLGNVRVNQATGSVHVPGQAVIKKSGTYLPVGNTGYYRNPVTGAIYNPYTQVYKTR